MSKIINIRQVSQLLTGDPRKIRSLAPKGKYAVQLEVLNQSVKVFEAFCKNTKGNEDI